MLKPDMWRRGLASVIMIGLSGCASAPKVPVACPQFVPSPQALEVIKGAGWKNLARRVIETYTETSSTP